MILLDTNVLSELMRPVPEPRVVQWMDAQPEFDLWISAITVAEIRLGIALLPEGKRKDLLNEMAEQTFQEDFSEQCLPYDCEAAREYALIVALISIAVAVTVGLRLVRIHVLIQNLQCVMKPRFRMK